MSPEEARAYLSLAVQTASGREAIRAHYASADDIIEHPTRGDDESTVKVAGQVALYLMNKLGRM